jgi:hypothetical protein
LERLPVRDHVHRSIAHSNFVMIDIAFASALQAERVRNGARIGGLVAMGP